MDGSGVLYVVGECFFVCVPPPLALLCVSRWGVLSAAELVRTSRPSASLSRPVSFIPASLVLQQTAALGRIDPLTSVFAPSPAVLIQLSGSALVSLTMSGHGL